MTTTSSIVTMGAASKFWDSFRMKLAPAFIFMALLMTTQFALSRDAHGAAIGMPLSTLKVGYGIGVGSLSVNDPNGATASRTVVQPFRIIVTDWFRGDVRYWGELFFQNARLQASQTNIGQTIDQYGVQLSAQKGVKVAPGWSPWLGVGVDLSLNSYARRHTIDQDGFLSSRFANRSEIDFGITFNLISEIELNREWEMGGKLEQRLSINGGIDQRSLSVFILNRF